MVMQTVAHQFRAVDYFLRAEPEGLGAWFTRPDSRLIWFCIIAVVSGAAPYGAVMGCWWSPLQGLYVAIKLPLLVLLTSLGNGLLNGMLAPLLGLNLSLRQSQTAVLVSFAYAALMLGAFSPVGLFIVWNTPPPGSATSYSSPEYALLQLTLVVFIAFAGVVGNVRLLPLLRQLAGSRSVARNVLLAWLAGNLFLGSQICWVLRPFVWGGHPVAFIGPQPFRGSFCQSVFEALKSVVRPKEERRGSRMVGDVHLQMARPQPQCPLQRPRYGEKLKSWSNDGRIADENLGVHVPRALSFRAAQKLLCSRTACHAPISTPRRGDPQRNAESKRRRGPGTWD